MMDANRNRSKAMRSWLPLNQGARAITPTSDGGHNTGEDRICCGGTPARREGLDQTRRRSHAGRREDHGQTSATLYLLNLRDPARLDPQWRAHVHHLIAWVDQHFGVGPFYGATGINEQGPSTGGSYLCCSLAGLGSDTARWAAVNALYFEKTGDIQAREDAYRSLNYSTYFASSDGRVSCCGQSFGSIQYWFSDGYSDYLRSFNWAMPQSPTSPRRARAISWARLRWSNWSPTATTGSRIGPMMPTLSTRSA